ncbi:hypothetical protein C0993_007597 [Termitomyces sp. T159_Od127]|nr:hypothetical protein C0993_007597 [Termitomyces sp. T159_Od127]
MTLASDAVHDEVNLTRLVRRLQRDTPEPSDKPTAAATATSPEAWIRAQGMLQHGTARQVLTTPNRKRAQRATAIRAQLDKVEAHFKAVEKPHRPLAPILPRIPRPAPAPAPDLAPTAPTDDLLPADAPPPSPPPPSSTSFVFPTPMALVPSLLPPPAPSTPRAAAAATTGASSAIQHELMDQVSHMAAQLRRNTLHFSELLRRDQAVVDAAREKLEGNVSAMQRERVRLRDHRGKSWGTTWVSVFVVLAVLVLFVVMVGVIRFT